MRLQKEGNSFSEGGLVLVGNESISTFEPQYDPYCADYLALGVVLCSVFSLIA